MIILTVWARIGTSINIETEDETPEEIAKATKRAIEEHDPGKLHFHFDGEAYIPQDNVFNCDGSILPLDEITL